MFDVGFQEIMLIFVILLIVVGPERLPKLARTMGLWIGKARAIVSSVKSEVEREIRVSELKQSLREQAPTEEFKKLANQVKSINSDLQSTGQEIKSSIESAAEPDVSKSQPSATTSSPEKPNLNLVQNSQTATPMPSPVSKPPSSSTNKTPEAGEDNSSEDKVSAEKL
jgi:sec-independent protein translocase protein TatB